MATPTTRCPRCGGELPGGRGPCRSCPRGDATSEAWSETSETEVPVLEPETRTGSAAPVSVATGGAVADDVKVTIRATPEFASVPASADPVVRLLVDVTAEGRPSFAAGPGPLSHVILLLDVSASMDRDDKYPVLRDALRRMVEELSAPGAPEVLLSLAVFARGAKTVFRDVPASTLSAQDVLDRIDASPLRFTRYTDVAGALKRAGRVAVEQLHANRAMPIRTYLLTDGRPQDLPRTRRVMSRIARLPIDVDAFAFGADADVALLQELVSGGRGGTVKQVREDTLADAFGRIAESARLVVSNRSTFELSLASGVVGSAAYRYRPGRHEFGENAFAGAKRFATDLGTIESGRTYSLLFDVRLPETKERATNLGRATLRLRATGAALATTADIVVPRAGATLPAPHADVAAASHVVAALSGGDAKTQLAALRVRRRLYEAERRDPHVRAVIEKAISALESSGSLSALTDGERATLRSHTCTAGSLDDTDPLFGLGR